MSMIVLYGSAVKIALSLTQKINSPIAVCVNFAFKATTNSLSAKTNDDDSQISP